MKRSRAVTLLELIIILLIVGVLLAIALPNFFAGRSVPIGSRTRSDMRSLHTAMESYHVDNQAYPPSVPILPYVDKEKQLVKARGASVRTISPVLTTPVAYITSIFPDSFSVGKWPMGYHVEGEHWLLYSTGPDRLYDLDPDAIVDAERGINMVRLIQLTYDPTNGTESPGDVWRNRGGYSEVPDADGFVDVLAEKELNPTPTPWAP